MSPYAPGILYQSFVEALLSTYPMCCLAQAWCKHASECENDSAQDGGLAVNSLDVQAVGLDMDYTLIHYDVNAWEGKAFAEGVANLQEMGCPVEGLTFQPDLVIRGLIVDKQLGNVVKADRFGCIPCASASVVLSS